MFQSFMTIIGMKETLNQYYSDKAITFPAYRLFAYGHFIRNCYYFAQKSDLWHKEINSISIPSKYSLDGMSDYLKYSVIHL